ncbi:MAG: TonB-dependent receptor [Terriglobales bacterium]
MRNQFVRAAAVALACPLLALGQAATVRGVVHDPNHRPIEAARVTLRAATHPAQAARTTRTNPNGEFTFAAVAPGAYVLTAAKPGFKPQSLAVTAPAAGETPVIHILLPVLQVSQQVKVTEHAESLNTQTSTTQTVVTAQQIARTPGASRANSLAMITDFVPGAYVVHDMLHVRGGHQESWFLDGIPVLNTNIASNVGPLVDPSNIAELQVQTGGYSAEYDSQAYGHFNAISPSGFDRNQLGELTASYGSYGQTNDLLSFGSHTDRFAYYASVNGNFSQLGLYPPTEDILHDDAAGLGALLSAIYNATPENQLRVVVSLQANDYQIPNTPAQQAAGIADKDIERDNLLGFTWTHTAPNGDTFATSPFYHFNRADYAGGPNDMPFVLNDDRRSSYYGDLSTAAFQFPDDILTAGFYVWGQHDDTFFGLRARPGGAVAAESLAPSANSESGFVEDAVHPFSWLHLNGGLNLTRYSGLVSENAADPRAGAALRLPWLGWTAHGYFAAYYQPPPLDTISGPLLAFAARQGFGFVPLHGERDQQWDAGLTIPVHGWFLNYDHFRTGATNFLDHDEVGNSDIFLPLGDAHARIAGNEVTLRSGPIFRRARWSVAYSNQIAEGQGPVTGGLIEFAPTGYFFLDHDQRNTVNTVLTTTLPSQAWATVSFGYGSGFLNGDGPAHLPPHSVVSFAVGKRFNAAWSGSVNVTNLTNAQFLLDNSNTFGGTHWEFPRQVFVQVNYRFHY